MNVIDPTIPPDQAMLLRLIDAKFDNTNTKIEGVAATLRVMNDRFVLYDKRFDDHEHRLAGIESTMAARQLMIADFVALKGIVKDTGDAVTILEKWQTEVNTTTSNASKWGSMVWNMIGGGVTAGLLFVASTYFQSQPVEHKAIEPTTTTITDRR
jgi:hypothetical protein